MKTIELVKISHAIKIGDVCGDIEPNITENTLFVDNGEIIGFYIKEIPQNIAKFIEIANAEF